MNAAAVAGCCRSALIAATERTSSAHSNVKIAPIYNNNNNNNNEDDDDDDDEEEEEEEGVMGDGVSDDGTGPTTTTAGRLAANPQKL